MIQFVTCWSVLALAPPSLQDQYDGYQYDEVDVASLKQTGGARLVNARMATSSKLPFVAALFLSSSERLTSPTCSAVIITQESHNVNCKKIIKLTQKQSTFAK